jgi:hypothetical protein
MPRSAMAALIGRRGIGSLVPRPVARSRMSPVRQVLELFLLWLVATLAAFIAIGREDLFFTIFFSATSILSGTLALRLSRDE